MYPTDIPIVVFINSDTLVLGELRAWMRPYAAQFECLFLDDVRHGLGVLKDSKAQILVVNMSMGGADVVHRARRLQRRKGQRCFVIALVDDAISANPDIDEIVCAPTRPDDLLARIRTGGCRGGRASPRSRVRCS